MKAADFAGKRVYLVGGSLGIGLAIARRLAALGADLVIFARRRAPRDAAVAELRALAPACRVEGRALDVADHAEVLSVMAETTATLGVPDVLVNCAGRARPAPFEAIDHAAFVDTLRANLIGCWSTVHALVPCMKERGGYVVNTASVAGLVGVFGYTDYCAAKFGVVGFSEALRAELRPHGITVSVLCPPDTATPGFDAENRTKPEETRVISAGAPLLTAEAVAAALLRGMARRRFLIVPGLGARAAVLAKRLAPRALEWAMDREVRRVAARRKRPPR